MSGFQAMTANSQVFSNVDVGGGVLANVTVAFPQGGNRDRAAPLSSGAFTQGDLYRDLFTGLSETSTGTTFSISGLAANTSYNIRIYSLDSANNNNAEYIWYNTTGGTSTEIGRITNKTGLVPASDAAAQSAFSVFATVTTNASGTLTFGHIDPAGTGTINAFVLESIPEPSRVLLLGLAGAFCVMRRRRPGASVPC